MTTANVYTKELDSVYLLMDWTKEDSPRVLKVYTDKYMANTRRGKLMERTKANVGTYSVLEFKLEGVSKYKRAAGDYAIVHKKMLEVLTAKTKGKA